MSSYLQAIIFPDNFKYVLMRGCSIIPRPRFLLALINQTANSWTDWIPSFPSCSIYYRLGNSVSVAQLEFPKCITILVRPQNVRVRRRRVVSDLSEISREWVRVQRGRIDMTAQGICASSVCCSYYELVRPAVI